LRDNQVEDWDQVSWVLDNLPVKALVKLEHVIAVNVKNLFFEFAHFLQFFDVKGSTSVLLVIVVVLDFNESVDEVLKAGGNVARVDVCAPDHLGVGAHFLTTLHLVGKDCGRHRVLGSQLQWLLVRVESWRLEHSVHIQVTSLFVKA